MIQFQQILFDKLINLKNVGNYFFSPLDVFGKIFASRKDFLEKISEIGLNGKNGYYPRCLHTILSSFNLTPLSAIFQYLNRGAI